MMSAWRGGFDDSQRNCFGDRDHQHRAFLVRDFGDGGNIFNGAEEIRRLDQDAGGVCRDGLFQFFQIQRGRFPVTELVDSGMP